MSRDISLFSGYSQKENRTTNYCLLVLRMLYEENPKLLDEALDALTGGKTGDTVGVRFQQQRRRKGSVPDGVILQAPFALYIETKNFDWFHDGQLESHLDGLEGERGLRVLLALANFDSVGKSRFAHIEELCETKYGGRVKFAAATFEDFVAAVDRPGLPKNLADTVADFRAYLDEQNLLPTWTHTLDVCNCAGIPDDIIDHEVYMCPARGGAYSHKRARYFGMYRGKRVRKVAEIEAVVDVQTDGSAELLWRNVEAPPAELVQRAKQKKAAVRPDVDHALRIFVLGRLYPTAFVKDTPGGMMGSKQYFDVSSVEARGAEELAEQLKSKKWTEL